MSGSSDVDAYIAALPEPQRTAIRQLRRLVTTAAPEADEAISYKMPGLKLKGKFFIGYDAYKNHCSLFGATDKTGAELGDEIAPYVKGKGTLQFPLKSPLPAELIKRVIAIRLREVIG